MESQVKVGKRNWSIYHIQNQWMKKNEVWHIFGNDFNETVINMLPSFVAVAVIAS